MKELYAGCRSGSELVATFIAVLELCRSGSLQIEQAEEDVFIRYNGDDEMIDQLLEHIEEET